MANDLMVLLDPLESEHVVPGARGVRSDGGLLVGLAENLRIHILSQPM